MVFGVRGFVGISSTTCGGGVTRHQVLKDWRTWYRLLTVRPPLLGFRSSLGDTAAHNADDDQKNEHGRQGRSDVHPEHWLRSCTSQPRDQISRYMRRHVYHKLQNTDRSPLQFRRRNSSRPTDIKHWTDKSMHSQVRDRTFRSCSRSSRSILCCKRRVQKSTLWSEVRWPRVPRIVSLHTRRLILLR